MNECGQNSRMFAYLVRTFLTIPMPRIHHCKDNRTLLCPERAFKIATMQGSFVTSLASTLLSFDALFG